MCLIPLSSIYVSRILPKKWFSLPGSTIVLNGGAPLRSDVSGNTSLNSDFKNNDIISPVLNSSRFVPVTILLNDITWIASLFPTEGSLSLTLKSKSRLPWSLSNVKFLIFMKVPKPEYCEVYI